MNEQDSPKAKCKGSKRSHDSDLLTYMNKLEQLVIQKRVQIVKERQNFQNIIQSMTRYFNLKGLSATDEFLNPVPNIQSEDDDIADWYAFLETKNHNLKKVITTPPVSTPVDPPKPAFSNVIRITKQDITQHPINNGRKLDKKQTKEEVKLQTSIEVNGNCSESEPELKDRPVKIELVEGTKMKRKRRTKKEMLEAKQIGNVGNNVDSKDSQNSLNNSLEMQHKKLSAFQPNETTPMQVRTYEQIMQQQGLFDLKQIEN